METWGVLSLLALSQALLVSAQTSFDVKDIIISECRIWGVFHVTLQDGYQLSQTQARSTCHLFGTGLATKAQVDLAHQQGFETCRYGWVEDGFLVIPRIIKKTQCGKNGTGVLIWKLETDQPYDGFCFRQIDAQKTNTCEPLTVQTTAVSMNPTETSLMDLGATSTETVTVLSSEPIPSLDTETIRPPQETNTFLSSLNSTTPHSPAPLEPHNKPTIVEGHTVLHNRIIYWALGVMAVVLLVVFVAAGVWYLRKHKKTFSYSSTGQPKEAFEAEVWSHNLIGNNSS